VRDWVEELACRAGFDGLPSGGRLIAILVVAGALGVAAWMWAGPAPSPSGSSPAPVQTAAGAPVATTPVTAAAPASSTVTVHVVGEVRHPGVYRLAGGSRAVDAVQAAGGLLGDADQTAVNLARVVADGEQIAVPREGQVAAGAAAAGAAPGPAGAAAAGAKVDLNTATAEQLDALPGIGPATAKKIVDDRAANGPFKTVDDLMRVPGIGPAKLDALKGLVTAG
jgi:competence protein ComEA